MFEASTSVSLKCLISSEDLTNANFALLYLSLLTSAGSLGCRMFVSFSTIAQLGTSAFFRAGRIFLAVYLYHVILAFSRYIHLRSCPSDRITSQNLAFSNMNVFDKTLNDQHLLWQTLLQHGEQNRVPSAALRMGTEPKLQFWPSLVRPPAACQKQH